MSSLAEVYDDLVDELLGPDPDWESEPEAPADAEDINRRLRRLAKVRAERAEVDEIAKAQIDQVLAWADGRRAVLEGRERWLAAGLEMYHRAVLDEDPSRKTISMPCGTLKSRAQQPAWEFDEEAFIAWAQENAPELVRVPEPKPAVDKAAVKKALRVLGATEETAMAVTGDGEIVPGVSVTVRPPSFSIDTDGAE